MPSNVTVINNDDNVINLAITAYTNEVDVKFTESNEATLDVHDKNINAHLNIIKPITKDIDDINISLNTKANIADVTTLLAAKSDILTTYTKTETDTLLIEKLGASDITVTKQGNTFNSANELVKLNSNGKLPTLDGSNLTNLPSTPQIQSDWAQTNTNSSDYIKNKPAKYDSGWFAVAVNTTYTKTHGLGTSNIKYTVLIADDASGTNTRIAPNMANASIGGSAWTGYLSCANTSTILSILTAANWVGYGSNGSGVVSTAYYRVIAEVI